jgi:hypothetical protein
MQIYGLFEELATAIMTMLPKSSGLPKGRSARQSLATVGKTLAPAASL